MQLLPDGTVVPHHLGLRDGSAPEDDGSASDLALHVGEVQRVVFPGDEGARAGQRFAEYEVLVQWVDPDSGAVTQVPYTACTLVNPLAGLADRMAWTLRGDDSAQRQRPDRATGLGYGSKVLLLCVEGRRQSAVILGGIRDEQDAADVREDGHNLRATFNGLTFMVDTDGGLSVTYGGKTGSDGRRDSSVDEKVVGSTLALRPNGTVEASTKNEAERLSLDRGNKLVLVESGEGKVVLRAKNGVSVGDATDAWVLGTTYRNAEEAMHRSVRAGIQTASDSLAGAAAALRTGVSLPTLLTAVQTVALTLDATAQALKAAAEALDHFESNGRAYLSKKNLTD